MHYAAQKIKAGREFGNFDSSVALIFSKNREKPYFIAVAVTLVLNFVR